MTDYQGNVRSKNKSHGDSYLLRRGHEIARIPAGASQDAAAHSVTDGNGKTLPALSSSSTPYSKTDRLRITGDLFRQGVSASEIARVCGISREQTRKDLLSLGLVTSQIRKAQRAEAAVKIEPLAASGLSAREISDELGMEEAAVRRIAREFNVTVPRRTPKAHIHGTINSYNNGCRCTECRAANTMFYAEQRRARRQRVSEMPVEKHGTVSGYENWGCKCPLCSAAGAEHRKERFQIPSGETTRKFEPWSDAEDRLVLDYDATARDLAILLKRTVASVNMRRRTLRQRALIAETDQKAS